MSSLEVPSMDVNVGLYGSGRMARGLIGQMFADQETYSGPFSPSVVNFRSPRAVDGFATELMVDPVYGRSAVVMDAREREVNGDRILPRSFFERRIAVRTASGREHNLILTAGDDPNHTQWDILGVGLVFDTTGDSSRDPQGHASGGGAEIMIATYPSQNLPTFVGGVNDSRDKIEQVLDRGGRCFSASSCSTGAITTMLSTIRGAGIEVTTATCEVTHALTQSDAVIDSGGGHSAFHTKRNKTGAQKEVSRIMSAEGWDIPFIADSTRVLEQVGSVATATLVVRGSWTPEGIVDAMKDWIKCNDRQRYIGIEERFAPDAGLIRGDRRTVVVDAASVQTSHVSNGDTICMLKGWFDNEAGYIANALRFAAHVVETRHGSLLEAHQNALASV